MTKETTEENFSEGLLFPVCQVHVLNDILDLSPPHGCRCRTATLPEAPWQSSNWDGYSTSISSPSKSS